ncbi:MAG TPA: DUF1634 domain-containing protein [Candidatus Bathyarchaeia archaeon]|nr:DUF1634 domain-containing protein [Candidatus Bathyarchaeia archaeon]
MDLNRIVSYSLRLGVVVSAALCLLGILLWATRGFADVGSSTGRSLLSVFAQAARGDIVGIVYLGVIVLVATPVLRVAISSAYFALARDLHYLAITLVVLAMMIFAIFLIPA